MPRVSVIIPVHNAARTVADAIAGRVRAHDPSSIPAAHLLSCHSERSEEPRIFLDAKYFDFTWDPRSRAA